MTVRTIINSTNPPFTWIDVVGPSREELAKVARRYGLHPMSVEDSLEPEHLPGGDLPTTDQDRHVPISALDLIEGCL